MKSLTVITIAAIAAPALAQLAGLPQCAVSSYWLGCYALGHDVPQVILFRSCTKASSGNELGLWVSFSMLIAIFFLSHS